MLNYMIWIPTLWRECLSKLTNSLRVAWVPSEKLLIQVDAYREWVTKMRNRIIEKFLQSDAERLCFLDDDTEVYGNFIKNAENKIDKYPWVSFWQWHIVWGIQTSEDFVFVWANLWFHKDVFSDGLRFDEGIFQQHEDVDFCRTLIEKNILGAYMHDSWVYHEKEWKTVYDEKGSEYMSNKRPFKRDTFKRNDKAYNEWDSFIFDFSRNEFKNTENYKRAITQRRR